MRVLVTLLLFASLAVPAEAQALYAAIVEAKGFVVGGPNPPSGLHRFESDTTWSSIGWGGFRNFGLAIDPTSERTIYLAGGNGLFRSLDAGNSWRITTGWEVTEVLDVAVDTSSPSNVYLASAHGAWRSPDRGDTWTRADAGIGPLKFSQSIAVDRTRSGHLLIGTEYGLYRSTDGATTWAPVGPRDVPIRSVRQSPHNSSVWLAGTQEHGLLRSADDGATWEQVRGAISQTTIYDVAFDPADPQRMAAAGFHTGLFVSTNAGRTWRASRELRDASIHAVAFDPREADRVWVGTIGSGVFSSENVGRTWTHRGLSGKTVYELAFTSAAP